MNVPTIFVGTGTVTVFPLVVLTVLLTPLFIEYVKINGAVPADPV